MIKYECFSPQGGLTMARSKKISVDRRGFLKGAAAGAAAALVVKPEAAKAQEAAEVHRPATPNPLPGAKQTAAETTRRLPASTCGPRIAPAPTSWSTSSRRWASNTSPPIPAPAFRGIHESLINYGGNKAPELLTCCHEESSVAMAHGYAKIEGKPMMVMAHGTVGLQHASMAIYNAYADRVPVYILLGNIQDGAWRRSDVEWAHSVQDAAVHGSRLHQVGRRAGVARRFRRIRRARVQDRDDAAHGAGGDRGRRGAAGRADAAKPNAVGCRFPS